MALTEIPIELSSTPGIVDNSTSTAITIDASQNVGIGRTPDANGVLQLNVAAGLNTNLTFAENSVNKWIIGSLTSSNALRFYDLANSREAMRIDASGNVGIGVSPSTKLHLGGAAPLDSIIRQDSTVSGTNWEIGEREAGKWQIWQDDGDSVVATFMSIGNVGIGQSNPTSPNDATTFVHIGNATNQDTSIVLQDAVETWEIYQNDDLFFLFDTTNVMTLQRLTGNVGIGTDSPSTKIHIQNDSDTDYTATNFCTAPSATISNTTSGALNYASLLFSTEANGEFAIGAVQNSGNTASDFVFASRTSGVRTERMRIDSSGNVGIGASSISDRLEIVTAGSSSTENALRLRNPFGFTGLGNGVALIFAQDRNDSEDFPMAKIQSYQSSSDSSATGDLDIYTRSSSALGHTVSFLAGGGIAFNGDRTQANALDDYEEGVWTPAITEAGTDRSPSYAVAARGGKYTKIGNRVFCQGGFLLTNKGSGSGSGQVEINGLPFPVATTTSYQEPTASMFSGGFTTATTTNANVQVYTGDRMRLWQSDNAAPSATAVPYTEITDDTFINVSISYDTTL